MELTVIGCGDAFGSGGRLMTSFHVVSRTRTFLIDCGASTMIGLAREGLAPGAIDTVIISHLHGDHFAGLVWMLIHGQHPDRREKPLTIVGPVGTEERLRATCEVLFPGSTARPFRFPVHYVEFDAGDPVEVGDIGLQAFEGNHPSGALSAALRIEHEGRTIAFSGDTEWVEALVPCAAGSDLFITECYAAEAGIRYHMNWEVLSANLERLTAKRVLISHMNPSMLARCQDVRADRVTVAEDGMVLKL